MPNFWRSSNRNDRAEILAVRRGSDIRGLHLVGGGDDRKWTTFDPAVL
jgi:hypothetical protein